MSILRSNTHVYSNKTEQSKQRRGTYPVTWGLPRYTFYEKMLMSIFFSESIECSHIKTEHAL